MFWAIRPNPMIPQDISRNLRIGPSPALQYHFLRQIGVVVVADVDSVSGHVRRFHFGHPRVPFVSSAGNG